MAVNAVLARKRRRWLELRQQDVAQQVGVTKRTLARWEAGSAIPRADQLQLWAEALGLSPADLLAAPPDAGEQSGAAAAEVRAPQAASGAAASGLDAAAAPATTERRAG